MKLAFALAVGGILTAFGLTQWRRVWSGELLELSDVSTKEWFPAGEGLRRGLVRATPRGIIAIAGLFTCVLAFTVADAVRGAAASMLDLLSVVAACIALVAMLLDVGVVLFNRPRWAVPPPLRQEPGAVVMWWQGRGQRD